MVGYHTLFIICVSVCVESGNGLKKGGTLCVYELNCFVKHLLNLFFAGQLNIKKDTANVIDVLLL